MLRTASATRAGSPRSSAGRLAVLHGAEPAGAGADVAEDHERGGAVVPALADVRAVRLFADRVEALLAHQPLQPHVAGRPRGADLQPLGLRRARAQDLDRDRGAHVLRPVAGRGSRRPGLGTLAARTRETRCLACGVTAHQSPIIASLPAAHRTPRPRSAPASTVYSGAPRAGAAGFLRGAIMALSGLSITWLGHGTFLLRSPGGRRIVVDPWLDGNPSCPPGLATIDEADLVLLDPRPFRPRTRRGRRGEDAQARRWWGSSNSANGSPRRASRRPPA